MSYHHLTLDECESILVLYSHHLTIRNIALRLKRNPSTISRELRRLSGEYKACVAQENYQTARMYSHKPSILSKPLSYGLKLPI